MLQRAMFVRNGDTERIKAGTTQCRLGCGCEAFDVAPGEV